MSLKECRWTTRLLDHLYAIIFLEISVRKFYKTILENLFYQMLKYQNCLAQNGHI